MIVGIAALALVLNLQDWKAAKSELDKAFRGETKPADRVQAVERLGAANSADLELKTLDALLRALQTELHRTPEVKVSGDVLEKIVDVLSRVRNPESIEKLISAARKGGRWRQRVYVIRVLARIPGEQVTRALQELVYTGKKGDKQGEPHVATAAMDALSLRKVKPALGLMHRVLNDSNQPWEARLGALDGILRASDRSSIQPLIHSLQTISDQQGRLKIAVINALRKITGLNLQSGDPNEWVKALNGGPGVAEGGGTQIRPTEFFGLKTESTRIIFLLDNSGSMEEPASDLPNKPPEAPKREVKIATGSKKAATWDPIDPKREIGHAEIKSYKEAKAIYDRWREFEVKIRLDLVKKEFIKALFWLDHRVQFAACFYSTTVTSLTKRMLPATWGHKLAIMKKVEEAQPIQWTNTGDALFDYGMQFAAVKGKKGKYEGAPVIRTGDKGHIETIGGPDTIYLLTDGEPNAGRFSPLPDPQKAGNNKRLRQVQEKTKENIANELKKVFPLRKVKVHTICVGDIGAQAEPMHRVDYEWLKGLSELTGGKSIHISGR